MSWPVWNCWEQGPAAQHSRSSPSSSLSQQQHSPGQSVGTSETRVAFFGDNQSVSKTLSPFPTPSKLPSSSSNSSCCSLSASWLSTPMASPSPQWHHRVPMASWGPRGTTGCLWHRGDPVGSLWHRMLLDL